MRITRQVLATAAAVGIAAAGGSAFTAGNTVPDTTRVGQAVGAVSSGYGITNVAYTLAPALTDGSGDRVSNVAMTVSPQNSGEPARQVRVRLTAAGEWNNCNGSTSSTTWTCPITTPIAASAVTGLDVVAVS